jgi:hypothetical protein
VGRRRVHTWVRLRSGAGGGEGGDDPLSGVGGVGPGGQKWLWLAGWAGPGVVGLAGASDYY